MKDCLQDIRHCSGLIIWKEWKRTIDLVNTEHLSLKPVQLDGDQKNLGMKKSEGI